VDTNSASHCLHEWAQFTWDDITGAKNSHSRAQENPHQVTHCHFEQRISVNVWCGETGNTLIVPHVIEGRVTALYYRNFLEKELPLYYRMRLFQRGDE
jgi:hypothetical protein